MANNSHDLWRLERPMPSSPGGVELGKCLGLEKKQVLEKQGPPITWLSTDT